MSHRIALFVTCLADWMRPSVAESTVKVLRAFGYEVEVPPTQTCCGQPTHNSGDRASTLSIAQHTIKTLEDYDYIVLPSGSCAGMIRTHYPALFAHDPAWLARAKKLADKTFEFTQFLVKVVNATSAHTPWPIALSTLPPNWPTRITYHDSCSGLRELGIKNEPRALIDKAINARGGARVSLSGEEDCCGFGGAFAVKFGEISSAIAERKGMAIVDSGADAVVLGDLGCMLNIEGKLRAMGQSTQVLHIAEFLAGHLRAPIPSSS